MTSQILIKGKHYRSLKGWKYATKIIMECKVGILPTAQSDFITLHEGNLRIYAHYAWDGPSGPTFDTMTFMRASLFHDALCQLIGEGLLGKKYRKYADQLLRQHCLEDGMSEFRAWYVYMAVRAYSKFKGM